MNKRALSEKELEDIIAQLYNFEDDDYEIDKFTDSELGFESDQESEASEIEDTQD